LFFHNVKEAGQGLCGKNFVDGILCTRRSFFRLRQYRNLGTLSRSSPILRVPVDVGR